MRFQVKFLKSAVEVKDFPAQDLPEIAITGRSNAGKSSFLNQFAQGWDMAKVSGAPGKTRLINFFEVDKKYRWVDLPGYGFSKRSGDEQETWGPMVEIYCAQRPNLVGALLVMDIRRDWEADEIQLKEFMEGSGIPLAVVVTKVDKLSRNEVDRRLKKIFEDSGQLPVFGVSNLKKTGGPDVEDHCYKSWIKNWEPREI